MNKASRIIDKYNEKEFKFFKIAIILYCFSGLISITMFQYIGVIKITSKICRYITYFMFALIAFTTIFDNFNEKGVTLKNIVKYLRQYIKKHIILLVLILVTIAIFISCRNRIPIIMLIILCGSFKYNFDDFIEPIFKSNIIFMALTMTCSTFGLLPDIVISRGADTIRNSLGYIYPLEFMSHFLFIVLMYIYIKKEKFKEKHFLLINIVNLLIFKITDARTGAIIVFTVTLLVLLINKLNVKIINEYIVKIVNVALVVAYPVISLLLGNFYNSNNTFWVKLNNAMSGRLYLEKKAIDAYGYSLFGQNISWVGYGGALNPGERNELYNYVDCAYIKNLLDYGIVLFVFIIIGYIYITLKMIKEKNIYGLLVIHGAMLISVMEPRLMQIEMNPFLFLMSSGVMYLPNYIMRLNHKSN